jgi:hypothetical protein
MGSWRWEGLDLSCQYQRKFQPNLKIDYVSLEVGGKLSEFVEWPTSSIERSAMCSSLHRFSLQSLHVKIILGPFFHSHRPTVTNKTEYSW